MDYAAAVNEEIKDLFAAGADVVQIDEPYMQARPARRKQYGVQVLNRALEGITGTTAVHICFGYAAIIHERPSGTHFCPNSKPRLCSKSRSRPRNRTSTVACLRSCHQNNLARRPGPSNMTVEPPAIVADRIRRALPYVDAERIVVAPDCGLKYLPRDIAFAKLQSMVEGARLVRGELS